MVCKTGGRTSPNQPQQPRCGHRSRNNERQCRVAFAHQSAPYTTPTHAHSPLGSGHCPRIRLSQHAPCGVQRLHFGCSRPTLWPSSVGDGAVSAGRCVRLRCAIGLHRVGLSVVQGLLASTLQAIRPISRRTKPRRNGGNDDTIGH